ncbi:hypothetical protein FOE67_16660, partial [Streptomyces calidiresistens]|nr:hypothetical protein [Streptomyces calidiresistens]
MQVCAPPTSVFVTWLADHLEEVTDEVIEKIGRKTVSTSPLYSDPALQAVLRSETSRLLSRIMEELEIPQPTPLDSPEAGHIARLAALHGTPLDSLVNAHWEALSVVQDAYFRAAREAQVPPEEALRILHTGCRRLLEHTSCLIETATREYLEARRSNETDENAIRLGRIQAVLNGPETRIPHSPYDVGAEHVAVVAGGPVAGVVNAYARQQGSRALAAFVDQDVIWAWFSSVPPQRLLTTVLAGTPAGAVGVGAPGRGVQGFRQSHREAQAAHRVCLRTGRPGIQFSDVIPESMALTDMNSTRGLVLRQLGRLAR